MCAQPVSTMVPRLLLAVDDAQRLSAVRPDEHRRSVRPLRAGKVDTCKDGSELSLVHVLHVGWADARPHDTPMLAAKPHGPPANNFAVVEACVAVQRHPHGFASGP